MTREEAKEILTHNWTRVDNPNYSESELDEAFFMAIDALSAEAVQGCDGCIYNTRIPQKQCLRCTRYWRDSYERKGGEDDDCR